MTADRLRVAILSPCWFPVPPTGYGGIEWIVALLADGLAEAGHDVTLFASGDSHTRARLEYVFPEAPTEWIGHTYWELRHLLAPLGRADRFDVLHDHTGMLGLALGGLVQTPLVHTVHGPLDGEPGAMYEAICRINPRARLVSLSLNQRRPKPELPWVGNVPNALDLSIYPISHERGDYLLFLGRMTTTKGCHRAIAAALEADVPLRIAGKCREPGEQQYFDEYVRPHLSDRIQYLGEVNHGEKVHLLQHARATLFPIEWEEPFGLVMIESMACGTPVIASRWGAVPEVIEDGVSGVIVEDYRGMADALPAADALDPAAIRRYAERRFSAERMIAGYESIYRAAIDERSA